MPYSNIDTDYGIGTILSRFDSEYITNLIQTSIEQKFRPFSEPMPNMVAVLSRQFKGVLDNSPDYKEQVQKVEVETYQEIIQMICNYYNLSFDRDADDLYGDNIRTLAYIMYDIFVARFTEYLIGFFVSYINRNSDFIYSYLYNDPDAKKARENSNVAQRMYTNPKFSLIHANLNRVIINMASYDIPFGELLKYLTDYNTAAKISQYITDQNDIYKYHFASYVLNQDTMSGILTSVKLALQSETISNVNVNIKKEG